MVIKTYKSNFEIGRFQKFEKVSKNELTKDLNGFEVVKMTIKRAD